MGIESMNGAEMTKQFVEHHTPRLLAGLSFMVVAIVVELIFATMMAYGGYSDELAIGIGISYATAAIVSIVGALSFVSALVPGSLIKSVLVCLIAPLVIQFQFITWFLYFLVRLPFTILRSFKRRKPRSRKKAPLAKPNRLEKLVRVRLGDTVTFTPPGEDAVIGVVRRVNAKSTTVVAQSGETWRVPHDESETIVRTKAAPIKVKSIRQLELVK